jgi:hypothetical protein
VGRREKAVAEEETRLNDQRALLETRRGQLDEHQLQLDEIASRQSTMEQELEEAKKALAEREGNVKTLEAAVARQSDTLKVREAWVKSKEVELEERSKLLKANESALDQRVLEASQKAVEECQAQQRAGLQRIANWAGEASSALVPLGMSPIQVAEPPASLSDALPVLDSAAEQLRRLDSVLGARLEAEGHELCRVVAEHILTCFRSHLPTVSLEPVIEGPVVDTESAARESVQEVVEIVAARFQRAPADDVEPDLDRSRGPPGPQ